MRNVRYDEFDAIRTRTSRSEILLRRTVLHHVELDTALQMHQVPQFDYYLSVSAGTLRYLTKSKKALHTKCAVSWNVFIADRVNRSVIKSAATSAPRRKGYNSWLNDRDWDFYGGQLTCHRSAGRLNGAWNVFEAWLFFRSERN